MESIATSIRISAEQPHVLRALTTTSGHRAFWTDECEVGTAVGERAVYRFGTAEVVFRIDRLEAHGIEMTCLRSASFPDWEGSRLAFHAVEDGAGTGVEILHDGWRERNGFYERCAEQWEHYARSLRAYCETGRGTPFESVPRQSAAATA